MILLVFIGGFEWIILFLYCILSFITLVDILRSNLEGNNKLVWIMVVFEIPILGSILYFFIGRNQKIRF